MKLSNNKKNLALILPLVIVAGVFIFGHQARADWAVSVVSGILGVFIWALGVILMIVIKGLILIAQYQSFIDSQAVVIGWVIVRDVCNMFFVVVMLIIAFGTILHLENYSYKKWLPKLILMAILINFSKTICGLLIDVSQVVMMTFVNAFKDVGGANMTDILGLSQIVTMAKETDATISLWTVVGAYVLGIIYLLVAVVVIVTMMMMLVMRLVMIWIYVVLSPAAFLTAAFPGGEKFSSEWWSEFTKNLLVGPVLAFFIWLSFASLQSYNSSSLATDATSVDAELSSLGEQDTSSEKAIVATEASKPASLIQFVIAIGMLLGGLKVSQTIGGAAGNLAGKGMGAIQKGTAFATAAGAGVLAAARTKAWAGAKAAGGAGGKLVGTALGGADRTIGAGIDKLTAGVLGKRKSGEPITNFANRGLFAATAMGLKNMPGNVSARISSSFNKNKEINERRREYLEEEKTKGANAVLTFSGKKYKKDESDNSFYEVNDKGAAINAKGEETRDVKDRVKLRVGEPGRERDVKAMAMTAAAWHDAWRASGSQSRAASNKAQEEKISKEQTKIADSGQTTDEMRRALMSASTSAEKKMALAMTLAVKAGFKDKKEVAEAKKYLGSNTLLQSKFNDEVDKNQTHLNYDLSVDAQGKHNNENDVNRFKNRIDQGKIDSTRLSAETFSAPNSGAIDILRDYHGADFSRVIESNYKKNKRTGDAVSTALLSGRKFDAGGKIDPSDKSANLHAKLTGKIEEAFTVNNKLDEEALKKYLTSAKAGDLNKIDAKDISQDVAKIISDNITFAKLKSMHKQGDNPELVEKIVSHVQEQDPQGKLARSISSDAELSTVSPGSETETNTVSPGSQEAGFKKPTV